MNDNFAVTSCNDDSPVSILIVESEVMDHNYHDFLNKDRRPELTIQIAQDYYTNDLSGQEGFVLADGFYSKKISEDDLNFEFSEDADGM